MLGKALGAGMPISAVSGSAAMLEPIVSGEVSQRGTFNGHPLSVAAALACLEYLAAHADDIYPRMERMRARSASTCATPRGERERR